MNFFEAMQELEKGKKVRKVHWDTNYYIAYNKEDNTFIDENSHIVVDSIYLNSDKWELYKEDILTEKEKEYLSNVIKPFKNRVRYIIKYTNLSGLNEEYIQICVKSYDSELDEDINLPLFVEGSMYKNMKKVHRYSLKELDL